MVGDFERYAVYWVPRRPDSLSRFGCAWMGWCPELAEHRERDAIPAAMQPLTAKIWRHGFHGVVKAPFRPVVPAERWVIDRELQDLAESFEGFAMPRLQVELVDNRVVLAPACHSAALTELLARVEQALAPVADLVDLPRMRRAAAADSSGHVVQHPAARSRFRVPLTDRLAPGLAQDAAETLKPLLAPHLDQDRRLSDLALMGDPGDGRPLRVLTRYELRSSPPRQASAAALPAHGPQVLAPEFSEAIEAEIAI